MKNYSVEEAFNLISNCTINNIKYTRHFSFRNIQRSEDIDLVYRTLLNKPIVGILKQDFDKFKVYYEHETRVSEDIILIIGVDDEIINLITTFSTSRQQRLRKYGM